MLRLRLDFVSGHGEPHGPCSSSTGMINQTLASIPRGIKYDTVYSAGYNGAEGQGAENIRSFIEAGVQSCPCQKYVLLGYSQRATASALVMNYFNDTTSVAYKAIRAVVLTGDPVKKANEAVNVDENGGDTSRSTYGMLYEEQYSETISALCIGLGSYLIFAIAVT
jgi:hypothetical protein